MREKDEAARQKIQEGLASAYFYNTTIEQFLQDLKEYSNKEHTAKEIQKVLNEEYERNNERIDTFILEFMAKVRREMNWLDSRHVQNIMLSQKDIQVFFAQLDRVHYQQAA